jgi:hypothetical protein
VSVREGNHDSVGRERLEPRDWIGGEARLALFAVADNRRARLLEQEMPGSDIVTGKAPVGLGRRGTHMSLQDAVMHRLGGVIDPGDVLDVVLERLW